MSETENSTRLLLVPKHDDEYAKVGTVAQVTDRIRLPGGGRAVALEGLHRGVAGAAAPSTTTLGAASAEPVPSKAASAVTKTATAVATAI